MAENLLIVESPAKASTIEKYLGKDFKVQSCFGHIRDLPKGKLAIDIDKNFEPEYTIPKDKAKIVSELKLAAKKASVVWLATDEDREGEAISWHLCHVLGLNIEETKRITFHEITKQALLNAIENPRIVNMDLVNAQQARRVLDRLVGFEVSPVLWKKIRTKGALSAGRVQSVALRLITEREEEILAFVPSSWFKIEVYFNAIDKNNVPVKFKALLSDKIKNEVLATDLLTSWKDADFKIANIEKKPAKKSPAPPFTTSSLQQEASRKLGFSVSKTMTLAQRLYEAGHITYMRTDSVNLSDFALGKARNMVEKNYGKTYAKTRKYNTKSKSAQEAHEAIRPAYFEKQNIEAGRDEERLYQLIWKRAVASQMADAKLERTTFSIKNNVDDKLLLAKGEVMIFDGFLKLYQANKDEDEEFSKVLPKVNLGQFLETIKIDATEKFSKAPSRFSEASLVKRLEELGIGRPSTYAKIIKTIEDRGYAVKKSYEGKQRKIIQLTLINKGISKKNSTENYGAEKKKLFPSDVGIVVSRFLSENFETIMDYSFTANIEKDLDKIASGQMLWSSIIKTFYKPFHKQVEITEKESKRVSGDRILGNHPEKDKPVIARIGRYGPMVQIGEGGGEEKPQFAKLMPEQSINTITLEEALELFKLPKSIGLFEEEEVVVSQGRFGPYIRHKNKFYSLPKDQDLMAISLEEAIFIIEEKRKAALENIIKVFEEEDIQVLKGRYGPYLKKGKNNYRIPKAIDPDTLSLEQCLEIVEKAPEKKKRYQRKKKS